MIGDAALAARFADRLLGEGVYVIGFSFPVVPHGEARIRTQMSAGLDDAQLERALAAFIKVGRELEFDQMKALVKSEARPGIWMKDIEVPKVGPNDVLIKIAQDRDLRHRHAHLQLGRLGAEDHSGADGGGPRVLSAASSTWAARCAASRVGDRVSGEGHITCGYLPQLPRRPPPPVPQHRRRRRGPPGLFRRIPRRSPPATRSSCRTPSPTTSPASSIRSATRRTPPSPSTWWARTC